MRGGGAERSLAQPAGMRNCWSHAHVLSLEVEMVRNEKKSSGYFHGRKGHYFLQKKVQKFM